MRITILKKAWNLLFVDKTKIGRKTYGECDSPEDLGKEVRILDRLRGEEVLDTIIHECLHAASWHQFDEKFVTRLSSDIARVLWKDSVLERILDADKPRKIMEKLNAVPA